MQCPSWVETVFSKRECIKFIPSSRDNARCCCGQLWQWHHDGSPATLRSSQSPDVHWSPSKYTQLLPTDAFGTIEFQGGAHPAKAQYIRLAHDTPSSLILELLTREWGLGLPKLLITIQGGKANFDLQPKLKKVIRKGLLKAAKTTGAWVFTAGTNAGVTSHAGEALASEITFRERCGRVVSVGIAPWGIVERRAELIGRNRDVPYYPVSSPKSRFVALNNHHTYFLLVDNGTTGKYGAEIILRRKLENYISQQRIQTRGGLVTPVVCVVIEGGPQTIRQVLEYITDSPPVPVIVCDGTGRAADILAFVHKYAASGNDVILENNRETIVGTLVRIFDLRSDQAEKLFLELLQCVRKKDLITVFRLKEGSELDQSILSALLHSKRLNSPEQLSLALTWNRVDIARKHVFDENVEWQSGSLEQAMLDALVNDRIEFVRLLLEQGVSMSRFLTVQRLEELYNSKQGPPNTLQYIIRDVRKIITRDYPYSLIDIGLVINKLMGGAFRSSYTRKKFRSCFMNLKVMTRPNTAIFDHSDNRCNTSTNGIDKETQNQSHVPIFDYPFSELMVWAVLTKRQALALLMWQHGEEACSKALIAAKLYKALAKEAADDDLEAEVYEELKNYGKEFEGLALDVLTYCYQQDEDRAHQLLTYELKNWSKQTCLSLAVAVNHRALLSHPVCQILLADLWLGGLRTRKSTNVKVILALVFPLLTFFLGFRSREELRSMPQTCEEHWDFEPRRYSDSGTDTDTDEENLELRQEQDQEAPLCNANTSNGIANHGQHHQNILDGNFRSSLDVTAIQEESCPINYHLNNPITNPLSRLLSKANSHSNHSRTGFPIGIDNTFTDPSLKELPLRTKFYEFYNAPITKFWAHSGAYIFFLCLFTYLVLVRLPDWPEWNEYYVLSYITTFFIEKIREILAAEPITLKHKVEVWSDKLWNVFDFWFAFFFLIGFCLRMQVGYIKDVGRLIYCVDIIYWYIKILEILSANKYLGPLVMMMGKMVKNMAYFVILLLVVLMAFGVCRQSILFPNEEPHWLLARHIFYQPYFMLYGEVFAGDIDPPCGGPGEITCQPGRWITPTVMSMYLLVANILLINLLIAVFNNIFTSVNAISHQVWMFQRFQVVMEFEEKPVFPPPLIIISHIHRIFKYLFRKWSKQPFLNGHGLKMFLDAESLERVHDFEEECVAGYLREKEQKEQMSTEERVKLTSERTELLYQRMEDINHKFMASIASINAIDYSMKRLQEEVQSTKNSYAVLHRFMSKFMGSNQASGTCSISSLPSSNVGSPKSGSQSSLQHMLEESRQQMAGIRSKRNDMVSSESSSKTYSSSQEEETFRGKHGPLTVRIHKQDSVKNRKKNVKRVRKSLMKKIDESSDASKRSLQIPTEPCDSLKEIISLSKSPKSSRNAPRTRKKRASRGFSRKQGIQEPGISSLFKDAFADEYSGSDTFTDAIHPRYVRSMSSPSNEAISKDIPLYSRSKSVSHRPVIQIIPPSSPPIITLSAEYTSLGDALENACARLIVQDHAHMEMSSDGSMLHPNYSCYVNTIKPAHHSRSGQRHYSGPEFRTKSLDVANPLRESEGMDYLLMEGLIKRRMHRDSENLAASLEDLCSILSAGDSEDDDNNSSLKSAVINKRKNKKSCIIDVKHQSPAALDNDGSDFLSVADSPRVWSRRGSYAKASGDLIGSPSLEPGVHDISLGNERNVLFFTPLASQVFPDASPNDMSVEKSPISPKYSSSKSFSFVPHTSVISTNLHPSESRLSCNDHCQKSGLTMFSSHSCLLPSSPTLLLPEIPMKDNLNNHLQLSASLGSIRRDCKKVSQDSSNVFAEKPLKPLNLINIPLQSPMANIDIDEPSSVEQRDRNETEC